MNRFEFTLNYCLNIEIIENDIEVDFLFKKGENKVTKFLFSQEDLKEKLNLGMWNHFPLRAIFAEENIIKSKQHEKKSKNKVKNSNINAKYSTSLGKSNEPVMNVSVGTLS